MVAWILQAGDETSTDDTGDYDTIVNDLLDNIMEQIDGIIGNYSGNTEENAKEGEDDS